MAAHARGPRRLAPRVQARGHRQLRHARLIEDPLNPPTAQPPVRRQLGVRGGRLRRRRSGRSTATTCRAGRFATSSLDSAALGRPTTASVYLPAGYTPDRRAALPADHRPRRPRLPALRRGVDGRSTTSSTAACMPAVVVAFVHPGERLVEYADDVRHHELPRPTSCSRSSRAELPAGGEPAKRCLIGASFGAVASLSAAVARARTRSAACCCSPARSPAPASAAGRAPRRCGSRSSGSSAASSPTRRRSPSGST